MGKGYSRDLRSRICAEIESGQSRRSAARRFGVSASTSVRLAKRKETTGSYDPLPQGRPPGGGKLAAHAGFIIHCVEMNGEITMPELAAKLASERGVTAAPATLSRFLIAHNFTVKKNTSRIRSRS